MTRIAHFSDTHLGFSEFSRADPVTGLNAREADAYHAFDRAIDAIIELHPDFVIHAGDLFHTPRPSNRAIFKGLEGLKRLVDTGIPTIVIAGNHSTPRVAASGSIFQAFSLLGIQASYGSSPQVFVVKDVAVHCLPHVPTVEALRDSLALIKPDRRAKFNVLVMHIGVRGAGEEYSLGEFNELIVNEEAVASLRDFDYIALGHYHRFMQIATNAVYSGSTERFSFREAGYDKGFVEFDLNSRDLQFHSLPCREMILLKSLDCWNKKSSHIMSQVEGLLKSNSPVDGKILRLNFVNLLPATWFELDQKQIRQWAANAFELRIEKSFMEIQKRAGEDTSIGGLAAEFSAYLNRTKPDGLERRHLQTLGEEYLQRAGEDENE